MSQPQPDRSALVRVTDVIPGIFCDLKYAGPDNFTGRAVYGFDEPYLRLGTALRLADAQARLLREGYSLKIWDAWRPLSAQFRFWALCPDDDFVADPTRGGCSNHNRGSAVDVTLVTAGGEDVPMPTAFDDFSARPDRDYGKYPPEAAANARLLERAMTAAGFRPYENEWWHYNDCDSYPVAETRAAAGREELWDAVGRDGTSLGFDLIRGRSIPAGVYHQVVEIFTLTDRGNVLVTRRHPDKPYGLLWEITGGSALKGETPRDAAARELWEETGISLPPESLVPLTRQVWEGVPAIYNVFAARVAEGGLAIRLQEGETVDFRLLPWPQLCALARSEGFFSPPFCRRFPAYEGAVAALLAGQAAPRQTGNAPV